MKLTEVPVISVGKLLNASSGGSFGGVNAEANAVDADYGSFWHSVTSPNGGSQQWLTVDISAVPNGNKSNVTCVWWGRGIYYDGAALLGSQAGSAFVELPTDYILQGSANGTVWTDLVTITNNRYNTRAHTGINLSGYNYFRFWVSRASGVTSATDDVGLQFDLRNVAGGFDDSFFFYGDSITWEGFGCRRPDNGAWVNIGPLANAIAAATGRIPPVVQDGGTGGWTTGDADTNKALHIGTTPCKYIGIALGTNDAHNAAIDLNTQGGVNSVFAQQVKTNYQSMITYAVGLGKKVIIPHIPWRADTGSGEPANVQIFNTLIDQLVSNDPSNVFAGPDLYTFYAAHPELLHDSPKIHPSWDNSVPANMYNGLTGYEHLCILWRDRLTQLFYSGNQSLLRRRRLSRNE